MLGPSTFRAGEINLLNPLLTCNVHILFNDKIASLVEEGVPLGDGELQE